MAIPENLNGRQKRWWGLFDFSQGVGLEIGPLHQTGVKREHADVRYIDVFTRAELLDMHSHNPAIPPDDIPETDYVLKQDGVVRSIPETVGDEQFDWVFASHVIEHVPDVIGWLDQLATVTRDGGALVLAVPDRRYCFDIHRPGTTVGQMIQANELGEVVPSVRAVYDYARGHAWVNARDLWADKVAGYENRIYDLDRVLEMTASARAGEYIDAHVWLFTPGTLVEQLIELRNIGLSEWAVETVVPTKKNELEFYAVLRRLPREKPWADELFAGETGFVADRPDWLAVQTDNAREVRRLRKQVKRLTARRDELESSLRWKIGGIFTAPIRMLRRLVRRGK